MKSVVSKTARVFIASCLLAVLSGCSAPAEPVTPQVVIPDLSGATLQVGESALASIGLVTVQSSENSDSVEAGNVIKSAPKAGESVDVGSQVKLFISKGPARITATDSYMEWVWVGNSEENWEFDTPYIQDDELVVRARPTFSRSFKWHDVTNNQGYGVAAVNDTFDKAVPMRIDLVNEEVVSGEEQTITMRVPLSGIEVTPPTSLYMRLFIDVNGRERDISLTLTMAW